MRTYFVVAQLNESPADDTAAATYLVKTSNTNANDVGYRCIVADSSLATDRVAQADGLSVTRLTPAHPLYEHLRPLLATLNGILKDIGAVRIDFRTGAVIPLVQFKQVIMV